LSRSLSPSLSVLVFSPSLSAPIEHSSAASQVVEARMVVHSRCGERATVVLLDDLLRLPMFEIVPPGPAEMNAAYAAFVAFGKGSGHPAVLNFGDVFSYALAKVRGLPLLYKGTDFSETDIVSAS